MLLGEIKHVIGTSVLTVSPLNCLDGRALALSIAGGHLFGFHSLWRVLRVENKAYVSVF